MINEKRLFARLLSKEDIVVAQSIKAKTASFDVVSRVITLPMYKDMKDINLTGFTCHEVGHAIHTDMEVMKLVTRFGHTVVNVVEDLRINNLMKSEFRGISNIFLSHYETLKERDFFGDTTDYKMGLIDKINIANKLRINLFQTPEEKGFWTNYSNIETFDELVEACEYVVDYYANNQEEKQEENQSSGSFGESEETEESNEINIPSNDEEKEEDDGEDGSNESEETETENGEETETDESEESESETDESEESESETDETDSNESDEDGEESENGTEQSDEEGEESESESNGSADDGEESETESEDETDTESDTGVTGTGGATDFDPNTIISETEENFENSLSESVEEDGYYNRRKIDNILPRTKEMKSLVIPYSEVVVDSDEVERIKKFDPDYTEFLSYKKKIVNRMVQTFNNKKAASEYHRRKFTETGSLNMRKLHEYKTNENIFLKNMKIAEGKNHGVIFYIDNSGSMRNHNGEYTVKQVSVMVDFCRKLNIPYSVQAYAYQSERPYVKTDAGQNDQNIANHRYTVEIMSDKQSDKQSDDMMYALKNLLSPCMDRLISYSFKQHVYTLSTSGTPLYATMINSVPYIAEFKKKNGVQIVNVMYFTDGDDGSGVNNRNGYKVSIDKIIDAETKRTYDIADYSGINHTAGQEKAIMITDMIKNRFNCNVFFFQLPSSRKNLAFYIGNVDWNDKKAKSAFTRKFRKDTFYKVERKHIATEFYVLYSGAETPFEMNFDKIEVKTDKSGKVDNASFKNLKKALTASNKSTKGANLFASLIAQKVAEGV